VHVYIGNATSEQARQLFLRFQSIEAARPPS